METKEPKSQKTKGTKRKKPEPPQSNIPILNENGEIEFNADAASDPQTSTSSNLLSTHLMDRYEEEDLADPLTLISHYQMSNTRFVVSRPDDEQYDFKLKLDASGSFKTLINIINPVLAECEFEVVKIDGEFMGLSIKSLDGSHTAMVIARLLFNEVYINPSLNGKCKFRVNMPTILIVMQSIPESSIEISRLKGDNYVNITSQDMNKSKCKSKIPLIVGNGDECKTLKMIGYKHVVEIDLQKLKNIVKTATSTTVACDDVQIRILEGLSQDKKISHIKMGIGNNEGLQIEYDYRSVTTWAKDVDRKLIVIQNDDKIDDNFNDPECEMQEVYNEKFSAKLLQNFLRAIDRTKLQMRLASARPLVITYQLVGGEDNISRVNFILAPKEKEKKQEMSAPI